MNSNNNNPFAYRSQGGSFNVGLEEGDNVSALVKVGNQLMCITRKNISMVLMADDVDPERTNPNIDHNVQHILPYGSDSEFVGRTLQQANILFVEHVLPTSINNDKGINISFDFLKEITSLDKIKNEYISEENKINSNPSLKGKTPQIPSFPNLEQKVKGFISNTDHAMRSIMELAQLFYPEIKNKGWEEELSKTMKLKLGDKNQFVLFIEVFKNFTERTRKIRNTIEHPDNDNILIIENYKLTPKNKIDLPSISFTGKEYTLPKMSVINFMKSTTANLLEIFELLMVHLCNLHAEPFANGKRIVISILEDKRQESEKHVEFKYNIIFPE